MNQPSLLSDDEDSVFNKTFRGLKRYKRNLFQGMVALILASCSQFQAPTSGGSNSSDAPSEGPSREAPDDNSTTPLPPEEGGEPTSFSVIQEKVFLARCQDCHSAAGQFTFENYDVVKSNLAKIENRVFILKNMPPRQPLTIEESNLLREWMDEGAPL